MSQLDDGTYVTDFGNSAENSRLVNLGYSIRLIETWHVHGIEESFIHWDAPELSSADLPF